MSRSTSDRAARRRLWERRACRTPVYTRGAIAAGRAPKRPVSRRLSPSLAPSRRRQLDRSRAGHAGGAAGSARAGPRGKLVRGELIVGSWGSSGSSLGVSRVSVSLTGSLHASTPVAVRAPAREASRETTAARGAGNSISRVLARVFCPLLASYPRASRNSQYYLRPDITPGPTRGATRTCDTHAPQYTNVQTPSVVTRRGRSHPSPPQSTWYTPPHARAGNERVQHAGPAPRCRGPRPK